MAAPIRFQPLNDSTSENDPFSWDAIAIPDFRGYNGSPNLKKSGVQVNFTQDMISEWKKCKDDVVYFSEKYIKIVHVDRGLIPIELYDYQKEIVEKFNKSRKTIVTASRQCGKTTTATVLILHYVLFHTHKLVGLLANKADSAMEIMNRIQLAYEYLPKWMQSGVVEWNKGSIELENGCKIIASATSGSAIRGKAVALLYLDETAFVQGWDDFYTSVYPTISSGKETKMLFTSCVPKGTLVYTTNGIHDISDFIQNENDGFYNIDQYSIYGHGGLRSGNTFYNNGKAKTRIFKTAAGHVEASLPHKFFCCDQNGEYKWLETKDITTNDYMIQIVGQNCFGKEWNISMPNIEGRKCKNTFKITEENKIHIAYFIGQLLSDGYVREHKGCYQVTISSEDDLYPMFKNIGVSCNLYDGIHYTANSKELVQFIKHLGIDITKKAPEKEIPSCILTAPKEIQASFLRGFMDGDGCARINSMGKVNVTVGLSSKKMIQQLNAMFCNFGIFSNYYEGYTTPSTKDDALVNVGTYYYRLEIVGADSVHTYFNSIGFCFDRKQNFVNHIQPNMLPDHVVPFSRKLLREETATGIWSGVHKNGDHFSTKTLLEIKNIVESKNYYGSEKIKFLYDNLVDKNIRFVKVKEIIDSENEVYDFSLPHDDSDFFCHSVLYNTILGHQTPNGLNHFYKFWIDAKENRNGFEWIEVTWDKVTGRDEAWRQDTLASMSFDHEKFEQEFNCQFLGSSGTLISGSILKNLVHQTPIYEWDGFKQYEAPVKEHQYAMLCDVSRGKGLDYSAFHVIDITVMPYRQVATYKSNAITPTDYAYIIDKIGSLYNGAHVLVEINDIGGQVSDLLFDDLDYDNLLCTESQGRKGKSLCGGGSDVDHGVRTTTIVKSKGCSILKLLIEQQQLIINDFDTINELSRFSKKGKSYEAEDGHDDLVMGLVLFAWMTTQPYFGNLTSVRTLHNLRDDDSGWDQLTPFGFIVDGGDEPEYEIDKSGTMWMKTDAWCMNY